MTEGSVECRVLAARTEWGRRRASELRAMIRELQERELAGGLVVIPAALHPPRTDSESAAGTSA